MVKPKILIFINSLRSGGAERVVSHLLQHLKNDFEIHLALYNRSIDYAIPDEVKIFDLQQSLKENEFVVFLKIPLLSYRLYRYCREHNIPTSIAFLNRPCYINALMRSLWGFKGNIVMCERTHQTTMLQHNSRLYRTISRNLVKFSYKRADLVLSNSYASKADLIENFRIKTPIRVIHNPIDLEFIHRQAAEPVQGVFEEGIFHFIYVGGFRKEKNVPLLLQAFYIIKHLPVKLVIVGGGALQNMLLHLVMELGIGDKVIFCGFDANPYKYIKRADCFVLSSHVEGFPNVILEALACGKPVISTDCKSGPREILAPGTDLNHEAFSSYEIVEYGLLTPVNDVANLAAAMNKVYEDDTLRTRFQQKAVSRAKQFDVAEIKRYFHVAFST
jgi:N-acetylgalactosamine-N,N'-diacetylbacillosaminyl-diphospho-undecaprenol 4-alpha-N-acetylgalactosaminyltransferase